MGVLLAVALAITASGPAAEHAQAAIGIQSFTTSQSGTQAGGHPDIGALINFCPPPHDGPGVSSCLPSPGGSNERLKTLRLKLPDGLMASPLAISTCSDADFQADTCAPATQLGTAASSIETFLGRAGMSGSIYNLDRDGSSVGRLGFILDSSNPLIPTVRFTGSLAPQSGELTFGGAGDFPATIAGMPIKVRFLSIAAQGFAGDPLTPFVTAPTSCGPSSIGLSANSYEDATFVDRSVNLSWTGCDAVPFEPMSSVSIDDTTAGVPSGYTFEFELPTGELPVRQSHVRRTTIELPLGTTIAPASVGSLQACSDAQLAGAGCPAESRTGTLEVDTPLVDGDPSDSDRDPVGGAVYFGSPTPGDPYRLFLVAEVEGVSLTTTGSMNVDESSGRIDMVLDEQLPVPIARLTIRLDEDGHLLLQNPRDCGAYDVNSTLTPWSGGPDVELTNSFQISGDGAGGPCASQRPFAPTVSATTSTTQARAHPAVKISIDRPAGNQYLEETHVVMPRGLVGSIAEAPLCPVDLVNAGTCGSESRIGDVGVDLGDGASVLHVDGSLFLGEPLAVGDVASLSFAVPAKAGPLDLGTFVTASRVALRGGDTPDVIPSKLPTTFEGVPLSIRKIEINVDRPNFLVNPSGCQPKSVDATFSSDEGATATGSDPYQVTGCDQLGFSPKMTLFVGSPGKTAARSHPPMRAVITQDPAESALASTQVALAEVLRPNVPAIQQKLCPLDRFEAFDCPPSFRVGRLFADTPLLSRTVSGGLYLVKHPGVVLPTLGAISEGSPAVRVEGPNSIKGVQVQNRFEGLPDVPLSRVELQIDGGNGGLLNAFRDICNGRPVSDLDMTAHSGKSLSTKIPMKVEGCGAPGLRIVGRKIKVTKRRIAPVKVECKGAESCRGRIVIARLTGKKAYRLKPGQRKTVKLKLDRRAFNRLKSKRKLRARISTSRVQPFAKKRNTTVTLKAPK